MTKRMTANGYAVQPPFAPYLVKLFWVLVLVWLGFLIGIASDQVVSLPAVNEGAVPSHAIPEDWHGNVRRSGWGD